MRVWEWGISGLGFSTLFVMQEGAGARYCMHKGDDGLRWVAESMGDEMT